MLKYTPAAYSYADAYWNELWEWLCDNTTLEGIFNAKECMLKCPLMTNKDYVYAFLELAMNTDYHKIKRISRGKYVWDFSAEESKNDNQAS